MVQKLIKAQMKDEPNDYAWDYEYIGSETAINSPVDPKTSVFCNNIVYEPLETEA